MYRGILYCFSPVAISTPWDVENYFSLHSKAFEVIKLSRPRVAVVRPIHHDAESFAKPALSACGHARMANTAWTSRRSHAIPFLWNRLQLVSMQGHTSLVCVSTYQKDTHGYDEMVVQLVEAQSAAKSMREMQSTP